MKKIFLFFATVGLLILVACSNHPGTSENAIKQNIIPVSDLEYKTNEDGDITITRYTGHDKNVIIPTQIEGKNVTQIGKSAFHNNKTIESVEISKYITLIDQQAFEKCISLVKISFPQGLKTIGHGAFLDCEHLSSINLPDSLTFIGNRAFANCTSLKNVKIPNGITYLNDEAFLNAGIESIDFENGIEEIGPAALCGTNIKILILHNWEGLSWKIYLMNANLRILTLKVE